MGGQRRDTLWGGGGTWPPCEEGHKCPTCCHLPHVKGRGDTEPPVQGTQSHPCPSCPSCPPCHSPGGTQSPSCKARVTPVTRVTPALPPALLEGCGDTKRHLGRGTLVPCGDTVVCVRVTKPHRARVGDTGVPCEGDTCPVWVTRVSRVGDDATCPLCSLLGGPGLPVWGTGPPPGVGCPPPWDP